MENLAITYRKSGRNLHILFKNSIMEKVANFYFQNFKYR